MRKMLGFIFFRDMGNLGEGCLIGMIFWLFVGFMVLLALVMGGVAWLR